MFAIRQFSRIPVDKPVIINTLLNVNTIKAVAPHIFMNTEDPITKSINIVGSTSIPSKVSGLFTSFVGDYTDTND